MAPTQPDQRVVWHPRQESKFVVGNGSQLVLYELSEQSHPEIRHIASQTGLNLMKCFSWSPGTTMDDLFAIGNYNGRIDLIRLETGKQVMNRVLSIGPTVSLPIRSPRAVNSLSFSPVDPNYLAAGLDKAKGDCGLMVWDIYSSVQTFLKPKGTLDLHTSVDQTVPPHTSKIPRLDLGSHLDSRLVQQHSTSEGVYSLTFLPRSSNQLVASISLRWLRMFDLRSPNPSTMNVATKVQDIATDPYDQHRVACTADGIISLWDTRRLSHPLLSFSQKDAEADGARVKTNSSYSNFEFSSTRRGSLATLEKDSRFVRLWDITDAQTAETDVSGKASRDSSMLGSQVPKRSWTGLSWSGSSNVHPPAKEGELTGSLILTETRRSNIFSSTLASFSLIPKRYTAISTSILTVNRRGDIQITVVHDAPKQCVWNTYGNLAIGAGQKYQILSSLKDNEDASFVEPWDIEQMENSTSLTRNRHAGHSHSPPHSAFGREDDDVILGHSSPARLDNADINYETATERRQFVEVFPIKNTRASRGSSISQETTSFRLAMSILQDDIAVLMKRRVVHGYSILDPFFNATVVKEDLCKSEHSFLLIDVWEWIDSAGKFLCVPTPRIHGFDFSYEGLLGIWEGLELSHGRPPVTEATGPYGRASSLSGRNEFGDFLSALRVLIQRGDIAAWKPPVATSKALQRQVALHLCDWSFREEDIARTILRWEKEGKYSRAACWLVFTRKSAKAIDLLMRSEDALHHMMSGTLAALSAHGTTSRSAELREHCERLVTRLQDPYCRAMLTFLSLGDWSDILQEESFPFRERLTIAFQFLDDKSLTSYLRKCRDRGNLDSLIVTGLKKSGVDILQGYVDRTGDIQTAASLGVLCPWKCSDPRVQNWIELYQDFLDRLKLHHHRVAFDVVRGQILQNSINSGDIQPFSWAPGQVLIRCNYCGKAVNVPGSVISPITKTTACPYCHKMLPRCSVCLMTLSIVPDLNREIDLMQSRYSDTVDDAIVICQSCRHGGHASHIMDWFFDETGEHQVHDACAVADCDCRCTDEIF